jgi:IclR family transcriptional regulator, acetate operon repressor
MMKQSATERAIDILELLVGHPGGLQLSDISDQLGIPKSIGHRLLGLLAERGFVRQEPTSRHYSLTLKLSLLGARHLAATGLGDVSQPILDRLAAATGELARLAVVEGDGLVWVAKAQGARHGLRYDPDAGMHVVLHATATGKAWLATLPEAEAVRIVAATGFATPAHFGPNALRDAPSLVDALECTRAHGYGLAIEEGEPGTAALAVVVRASAGPDAPAVGTLSVAGPVGRFSAERQNQLVAELRAAAAELSALWPMRSPLADGRLATRISAARSNEGDHQHVV